MSAFAPQLVLLVAAFVTLLTSVMKPKRSLCVTATLTALAFAIAGIWSCCQLRHAVDAQFSYLLNDRLTQLLTCILSGVGILSVCFSYAYWSRQKEIIPEVYSLTLFATLGMIAMSATTHLLTLILALETMSLSLYVMVALRRQEPVSSEAAFKYFLLGSVAAAFSLMGIAWLYGASGTLDLTQMLSRPIPPELAVVWKIGAVLFLLGLVFKVGAVPLHFWVPDVYAGSPMPVLGFMAAAVKVAAFGALLRVTPLLNAWADLKLPEILAGIAVATMVWANLAALRQREIKRLFAYSSIAHAGYLLVGLASMLQLARGDSTVEAALQQVPIVNYLAIYALLTVGAAGILAALGNEIKFTEELRGLSRRHPFAAFGLSAMLIGLAGIPPLPGFFAKYGLLSLTVQSGYYPLAIVMVVTSAISLYYYLAPVVAMYFESPLGEGATRTSRWAQVGIVGVLVASFFLGFFPLGS